MTVIGFLLLGFLPGCLLQQALIGWAASTRILALPNERSSHAMPTPTMGGVGFVLPMLLWGGVAASLALPGAIALVLAAALIAGVGLWDDLMPLPASLRLCVHALAVALALVTLHRIGLYDVSGLYVPGWMPGVLMGLGLLWLVNLYNFMDGIDGLAAAQCLLFTAGLLLLGDLSEAYRQGLALLGGAVAAFFLYNRAPARIFMGDVGSGFLGFVIGITAVGATMQQQMPLLASVVLLTPFITDASYTLCVRWLTGQRIGTAHRSHAYQKAARRLGHGLVTWIFIGYGLLWLLPLAWIAVAVPQWGWLALACGAIPVLGACLYTGAGLPGTERIPQDR